MIVRARFMTSQFRPNETTSHLLRHPLAAVRLIRFARQIAVARAQLATALDVFTTAHDGSD
jgi:hypothetical protein